MHSGERISKNSVTVVKIDFSAMWMWKFIQCVAFSDRDDYRRRNRNAVLVEVQNVVLNT
jgi:hypothetical protein